MKIKQIKLLRNGTKGLGVIFTKGETKGGVTFMNDYNVNYGVPVNSDIRTGLIRLESLAGDMLGLDGNVRPTVVGFSDEGGKVKLLCKVLVYDNLEYNVITAPVSQGSEFSGYGEMMDLIDKLVEDVMLYIQGASVPTVRQMVLDLGVYGDAKQKKSVEGFEELGDVEQLVRAKEILEKQGCIVMEPEEYSVEASKVDF